MKTYKYLLLAGLFLILSFLLSVYFYQENVIAMRAQSELLFDSTLENALGKKIIELNIPQVFFQSNSDTIPSTICITTAEGKKEYKIDAEKSRKNISRNFMDRSLHSVVWEESPLSLDTLSRLWAGALHAQRINAKTKIHVSRITLHGDTLTSSSVGDNSPIDFSSHFVSYIGNRCEIEVIGFLEYRWWAACLYYWPPFLWILVGAVCLFYLLCLFCQLVHRPVEIIEEEVIREVIVEKEVIREVIKEVSYDVIVEKEVIREVIKEVPREVIVEKEVIREVIKEISIPILVKGLDDAPNVYELHPGLLFDARKQVLVLNGVDTKLAPQSCVILKIFLDAPGHTLSDTEILKSVWGENGEKTIKDFTVACSRLSKALSNMGLLLSFRRLGHEQYCMVKS